MGREAVTASKRQSIIDGMLEAVGAEGYEATSVRTVLDYADVHRQAFYDCFDCKEDCYLSALEEGIARLEARVAAASAGGELWRDKARAGLACLLDCLDAKPNVGRALIVEVHGAGPEAQAKRAEALRRASRSIDLARRESPEPQPPQIAAEGVVSGIHAVLHARLSSRDPGRLRALLPELMYFAVLPYFGAQAAAEEMRAARA